VVAEKVPLDAAPQKPGEWIAETPMHNCLQFPARAGYMRCRATLAVLEEARRRP
jgi:hypothetical protein